MMAELEIRLPKEDAPLQATKWLKIPVLLEGEEFSSLLNAMGNIHLFPASGVLENVEAEISVSQFVTVYKDYLTFLKEGRDVELRKQLSKLALFATTDISSVYLMEGASKRYVLKPRLPNITFQAHYLSYSSIDHKFRSQVFGKDSILWGVLISYPQLYQEPTTADVKSALDLPNGQLFKEVQKWIRVHTKPTPFLVEGEKQVSPIRLGKECFSWINEHPHIKQIAPKVIL